MEVLSREWENRPLLPLLCLQRDHGLFNVVIVRLKLGVKVDRFLPEVCEGLVDSFHFPGPLDTAAMFSSDIISNGIEEILVCVAAGDLSVGFEEQDVFESNALEFGITHPAEHVSIKA